nr:MAG TPA: hypothetical protein [Caudoviricetes sp.]
MKAGKQRKKFKRLSKLLNDSYRKNILETYSKEISNKDLKIPSYAKHICELQLRSRNMHFSDDKTSYYGFPPINFLCAKHIDGTTSSKIIEFKTINNLLKTKKINAAVEIIEILLAMMVDDDHTIVGFESEKRSLKKKSEELKPEKTKYVF